MRTKTITPLNVRLIDPDIIEVGPRKRELQEDKIDSLMESIQALGQLVPITVTWSGERPVLVAGLHRLVAFRRLKQDVTACIFEDEEKAKLWEISENLHRADLTAAERQSHLAAWLKLNEAQNVSIKVFDATPSGVGGRGKKGGVRQLAREVGIPEPTLRRDLKVLEAQFSSASDVNETARGTDTRRSRTTTKHVEYNEVNQEYHAQVPGQLSVSQGIALDQMNKTCFLDHYSNVILDSNHQIPIDEIRFLDMTPVDWLRAPPELRYFCGVGETTKQWYMTLREFEQSIGDRSLKAAFAARFRKRLSKNSSAI